MVQVSADKMTNQDWQHSFIPPLKSGKYEALGWYGETAFVEFKVIPGIKYGMWQHIDGRPIDQIAVKSWRNIRDDISRNDFCKAEFADVKRE